MKIKKNKRYVSKPKNQLKIRKHCGHLLPKNKKREFIKKKNQNHAPGEDRTHDLQITLAFVIMRLTRCLLRYRGRRRSSIAKLSGPVSNIVSPKCKDII